MPDKHALLSASSSERWLHCPPLPRLEALEPNRGSSFAQEGTDAHTLAEIKLRYAIGDLSEEQYHEEHFRFTENATFYNEEMEIETDKYVNLVLDRAGQYDEPDIHIEQRVSYDRWAPQGFGTADTVIATDGQIEIIDLKYGKGIQVYAEQNSQLMLYALGVYARFDLVYSFETVRMTIVQPRLNHISTFEMHIDELLYWAEFYVRPRAEQAWLGVGDYDFKPGILRFSPVKATLKERARRTAEIVEEFEYRGGELLSDEELTEALAMVDEVAAWAKDLKDYAVRQMKQGHKIDGFKLVEGRGRRIITDEEELASRLQERGYEDVYKEPALKSMTELEKELGKSVFADVSEGLIEMKAGNPQLKPETAKGKEWRPVEAAEDEFGEWTEG